MPLLNIRPAQCEDVEYIELLLHQLGYNTAKSQISKMVASHSKGHEENYVATYDDKVVGVISLIYFNYFPSAQRLCRITALVVEENIRGSGIGSKMIEFAKNQAINENCEQIELTTSFRRTETQAYYEKIGFKKTSFKYIFELSD